MAEANGEVGKALAKLLASQAQKAAERKKMKRDLDSAPAVPVPKEIPNEVSGSLAKPTKQTITEDLILWEWDTPEWFSVLAAIILKENQLYDLKPGEYIVQFSFNEESESPDGLVTLVDGAAKVAGEALLSANNWENVWKHHVGDLLISGVEPEVVEPEVIVPGEPGKPGEP